MANTKVSLERIKDSYRLAKQYHYEEIELKDAKKELARKHGLDEHNADTGIVFFKKMMLGNSYTGFMSKGQIEHYLRKIYDEFGRAKLQSALLTVEQYIKFCGEHAESQKLIGVRKIHNTFSEKIGISPTFQNIKPYDWIEFAPETDEEENLNFISKGFRMVSFTARVKRYVEGPCMVYLLQYGKRDIWKIGISQDTKARLKQINTYIPHEVIKEKWKIFDEKEYKDVGVAFEIEQRVLELLTDKRQAPAGERVICSKNEVLEAWKQAEKEKNK